MTTLKNVKLEKMPGFPSRAFFAIVTLPYLLPPSEQGIASKATRDTLSKLQAWFSFDVTSASAKPAREGKMESDPAQAKFAAP